MTKRILLTGIGGFIGAHCLEWWLKHTDWEIIGIDSFRHKGTTQRFIAALDRAGYEPPIVVWNGHCYHSPVTNRLKVFVHDLSVPIDSQLENMLLDRTIDNRGHVNEKRIHYIVNMASDSAVERSATDPVYCLKNNYDLTINMLEFARRSKPNVFVQISTDEVYGEAPPKPSLGHKEWSSILPSNPYAASKAAQEAVAIAYWRTFDVPVILTNCMNVIGEWQNPEKMVPKIIQYIMQGKEMPIYADPISPPGVGTVAWTIGSRIYTDARCKADALKFLLQNTEPARYSAGDLKPSRYNIVGEAELDNLEVAQKIADIIGKDLVYKLIPSDSARPGYDRRYALDGSLIQKLGWQAPYTMDQTFERVVKWTLDNPHWLV